MGSVTNMRYANICKIIKTIERPPAWGRLLLIAAYYTLYMLSCSICKIIKTIKGPPAWGYWLLVSALLYSIVSIVYDFLSMLLKMILKFEKGAKRLLGFI